MGTRSRLEAFAGKLLRGQPATVVTLGGSVTFGAGASDPNKTAWPARLLDWLEYAFPRSKLTLLNRAIPATTSGLTALCAERLVPKVAGCWVAGRVLRG